MKKFFTSIGFVALTACSKDPVLWKVENLNPNNEILILGHAGMGIESLWPSNSRESLETCLGMGADGTEMDVQMSKDGVLFLFHDPALGGATSCEGSINEKTADEINCHYKSLAHPGLSVVQLSDFLASKFISPGTILTFDCKLADGSHEYLEKFAFALQTLIKEFQLLSNCNIESTSPDFLSVLKKSQPSLNLFVYTEKYDNAIQVAQQFGLRGITMDMNKITSEQIKETHQKGIKVALFGQRTEDDNLTSIQMSPDYIQTDELKHALKVFEKYK